MASSLRSASSWLRPLLQALLALWALQVLHPHAVAALPITSRPIEGNAQLMAWEEWLRLPHEQKTLEKEKKVTAKSIFTLPFRHCPPGHKLYNERCIPQINIDPTDLVKQELLGLLGDNEGRPPVNTDYDYGDESDELLFDVPLLPAMQTGLQPPPPPPATPATGTGAEDQALPSEDAPLKFNIFESKFLAPLEPLNETTAATATATAAEAAAATSTTAATSYVTATTAATVAATPTIASMREEALKAKQDKNRIAAEAQDLQADASVALPSSTTLSIPTSTGSSSTGAFGRIGYIDAIVLPAGGTVLDAQPSVQLVTSSASDELEANTDAVAAAASAAANADAQAEPELAQLLKVDSFLPAYDSSQEPLPPFSHRRVAPLLSAVDDAAEVSVGSEDEDETAATDVPPIGTDASSSSAAPTSTPTPTTQSRIQAEEEEEKEDAEAEAEAELDRLVLEKSKVQPVQLSSSTTMPTTTTATMAAASATTTAAVTAATTETAATVAAIHQADNGKARDDDRFYYQHIASSSSSSSSSSIGSSTESSSSSSSVGIGSSSTDLNVLNDMASSDNLMTNTIGEKEAASEINFEQELRIINELVKGKRRLSQQQQQQQQQNENNNSGSTTATISTAATAISTTAATILQNSLQSASTAEAAATAATTTAATTRTASETTAAATATTATATAATESTTFWSKLGPKLGLSSTEAATEQSTEIETTTAAATATTGNVADSSTAAAATQLSINTDRSNRNSKIIRVNSLAETSATTATTTTTTEAATTSSNSSSTSSSSSSGSTPFWWLPNIGWRLDRQVDNNGEDRSLLLRFFRTFNGNESNTSTTATYASRR